MFNDNTLLLLSPLPIMYPGVVSYAVCNANRLLALLLDTERISKVGFRTVPSPAKMFT